MSRSLVHVQKQAPIRIHKPVDLAFQRNRNVGMGWRPGNDITNREDQGRLIGALKGCCTPSMMPQYNIPIIDNVSWDFGGPLTDQQVASTFGDRIDVLNSNPQSPPPGVTQVDTTFAQPGEFQRWMLVCGIQVRVDFEPVVFTVFGNGLTTPTTAQQMPVSPDDFTSTDSDTSPGTLGLAEGQTLTPAVMSWGTWAEQAMYYMALGYNLEWQYGNRDTLINESAQFSMFAPTIGEGASDSDVAVYEYVRRMNAYNRTNLAASDIFLWADRSRLGNEELEGTPGQSVYRPTRAYEIVGATYGGTVMRSLLRGRAEFKRFGCPFLIPAGVPIGLRLNQANEVYGDQMRNNLSATGGLGGTIPETITPDVNILAGASAAGTPGLTGVEPSFDTPPVANSIQLLGQRQVFKGGNFRITFAFRGFELTPEQSTFMVDPNFLQRVEQECGCKCFARL